jgi:SagB-type dehydrogenase family enzyme
LGQEAVRRAPAALVVCAVYSRMTGKYRDRGPRYAQLEAGHAAQNVLLQAAALGLGGVSVGAMDDAAVQKALALPKDHEPLYIIPVGYPD